MNDKEKSAGSRKEGPQPQPRKTAGSRRRPDEKEGQSSSAFQGLLGVGKRFLGKNVWGSTLQVGPPGRQSNGVPNHFVVRYREVPETWGAGRRGKKKGRKERGTNDEKQRQGEGRSSNQKRSLLTGRSMIQ